MPVALHLFCYMVDNLVNYTMHKIGFFVECSVLIPSDRDLPFYFSTAVRMRSASAVQASSLISGVSEK